MIPTTAFSAEPILARLLELVKIESPTYDPAAVNRMEDALARQISELGFSIERIPGRDGLGDILVARRAGKVAGPGLLMIAHADTVHPVGTITGPLPIRRDGDRCYGPAIYDMKGGTVMMLEALRAVLARPNFQRDITIIINPDEEIGSPTSRDVIEAEARRASHTLVPEPAKGPTGEVTTGRHAFQRFFLTTHGRPAHSGWTNKDGRSAVRIMAQLVEELESKSDYDNSPTYAVSVFHGGQWVNCVPMTCTAQALCVSRDDAKFAEIGRVMDQIVGVRNDVRIEVKRGPVRPLWTASSGTMQLYESARAIARDLGFDLPHGQHGGGSDGNFTGALGIPTLDGLGVMGNGAHTHEEHILVSSLVPRTTMLARLIETLA
ncbi:MAG TPA: M20/M25/M40 family metallo-hydrolase, partial [Hyphomicrobiaceae bacterium]|nr:M20/M25/M40 family metallo-hydrolase [Hyphomicrobiaceae bacterium]